jgi:imidazolonepropionase-like amidohydrolase
VVGRADPALPASAAINIWLVCSALVAFVASIESTRTLAAQEASPPAPKNATSILINNTRILDGVSDGLRPGNLLIVGSKIKQMASNPITPPPHSEVIDGGGRVPMPGLTDAHWHMTVAANTLDNFQQADPGLMHANTVAEAHRTLLRGFTTVRDMAGPTFGIKAAIDAGVIPGGAFISQTSGHGDFAAPYGRPKALGGRPSHMEDLGEFTVADGVTQVLAAVREQLKKGASQIKLGAGGGVISDFDPIDSLQFTPEEMRAAVQTASDWGTYVAAHVYTAAGIRRALNAGVL